MPLKMKKVSFEELKSKAKNAVYVGATVNIDDRSQIHGKNYNGEICYFKTQNMRQAENTLLQTSRRSDNIHQESNVDDAAGYVYAIIQK